MDVDGAEARIVHLEAHEGQHGLEVGVLLRGLVHELVDLALEEVGDLLLAGVGGKGVVSV